MRERATAEKDSLAESQTRGSRGVHITALPRFRCPVWLGRDMASELGARPGLACGWCQAGGKTVDGTVDRRENGQMEKIPGVRERCGPGHSTGSSCLVDPPPPGGCAVVVLRRPGCDSKGGVCLIQGDMVLGARARAEQVLTGGARWPFAAPRELWQVVNHRNPPS